MQTSYLFKVLMSISQKYRSSEIDQVLDVSHKCSEDTLTDVPTGISHR